MARVPRNHSYPPRGLRYPEAARWIGVGRTKFLELVNDGRISKPRRIDGVKVWDRYQLDQDFDELPSDDGGIPDADHTWDDIGA